MKKLILKVLISITLMLCVSGCTIKEEKGEIKDITYSELQKKINNKDTFILQFSKTTCSYCKNLEDKEEKYILENDVIIYRFIIDDEKNSNDYIDNKKFFSKIFPDLKVVPTIYKIDNGKPIRKIPT